MLDDDVEDIVKEEEKPDTKVLLGEMNGSSDIKPLIKTEFNPETKVKIEKQEPGEAIDQKPVKTELDASFSGGGFGEVKIEKNDQSFDEKPELGNPSDGSEVSKDNQMQATDKGNRMDQVRLMIECLDFWGWGEGCASLPPPEVCYP